MIVLQVLPALVSGGVERGTIETVAALVAAGHSALVASAGGPMTEEVTQAGGTHITLPLATKNPFVIWRNAGRLAQLIKDYKIDIVHARSRAPAWSAYHACRRAQTPFVTTFHNAYGAKTWLKRRYNAVMARGARVIAISHFVAAHVRQTYDVPATRLRVIPRGVDTGSFDPARINPARINALRTAWKLDAHRPVIMLPGRIGSWKGHDILIAALARLKRPDFQTVFVGSGDADAVAALERQIAAHGLGGQVKCAGACRDMPAALMLASVVVSPATRPEGFGRVIVEAQAMGKPVIATDHGGARETVIAGETGWLVPPNNAAMLADRIAHALELTATQKTRLAARAIAHVREHFTTAAMTAATLKVYEEVCASK